MQYPLTQDFYFYIHLTQQLKRTGKKRFSCVNE